MPEPERQLDLPAGNGLGSLPVPETRALTVTLDLALGGMRFEWTRGVPPEVIARGQLEPTRLGASRWFALDWTWEAGDAAPNEHLSPWPAATRAFVTRLRKKFPVAPEALRVGLAPDTDLGPAKAGSVHPLILPVGEACLLYTSPSPRD